MHPPDFLSVFIQPLEIGKFPYFVTGSIASIFYGEPRLTHDIDLVIHLSQSDALRFASAFPEEHYYCPPEDVIQIENRRRPFGHFNLIHHESGLKADIYPDAGDPLHHWAFQKRRRLEVGSLALWLAPPEYVILRKLEFFREGGSDKHLFDIKKMLPQVTEELDLAFLNAELQARGLLSLWQQAQGVGPN